MLFASRTAVLLIVAIASGLFLGATPSCAQEVITVGPGGQVIRSGPGGMRSRFSRRGGPPRGPQAPQNEEKRNDEKKNEENKEEEKKGGEGGNDAEGSEESEAGEATPVTRPEEPPTPPDPRELQVEPDASGRVSFSFHGQPWVDVLQWLAGVSDLSLDWREVPGDYLNLTTTRAYSLPEARDLINRHLQARGYTLLLSGEVLSVFKLEELEPSLVPRISEDELYDRQPHDIVKISLPLPPGLEATKAVEDLKQALGPHAKALPLAATKRVLLIDNVANLRMVSSLLGAEIMAAEGAVVPREFLLEHVQASTVIDMLYVVLGLDPNTRPSQMELRLQQQKLELMGQMAQRGKDVMRLMDNQGPKVYLIYNRQRNSILANAPPEQMEIIERTITALDVPKGPGEGAAMATDTERRLEQYKLKSISPSAVKTALEEIGDLSPRAELKDDADSKTLFARASEADHAKIKQLVEQLDSADAIVKVFVLRRLPADAVAGTVRSVLATPPKEEEDDWRRFRWGYDDRRRKKTPATELKVDADVANNRLIVRGTRQQIDEVRELLIELGEPLDQLVNRPRVRVLDPLAPDETRRLLERLKAAWPSISGGNQLVLPANSPAPPREESETEQPPRNASELTSTPSGNRFRLLANQGDATTGDTPPPVSVQIDANGRMVISSDDTDALDKLQELVGSLAPAPARFEVFTVKNRSPQFVVDKLETYFEDELAGREEAVYTPWGEFSGYKQVDSGPTQLSQRRELRFMADDWSSSILVANASPAHLAEIERLIESWDRKPLNDRILGRRTETVRLRYAKASTVVNALKDVYRDMLSSGDREFDTPERKAFDSTKQYLTTIRYDDERGNENSTEPTAIGFDGLLSLGSDDEANVVIVSANEEVFESVAQTIRELDEQAKPTGSVAVRAIEGGVAADEVRSALLRALATDGASSSRDRRRSDDRRRDYDRRRRR